MRNMKRNAITLIAGLVCTSAFSQTTYQRIGNTTYSSTGQSYQQIGNQVYGSDGTTYNRSGNATYTNDGRSYQHIGNQTYGSDGTTANRVGNSTYINSPSGHTTTCQRIGSQTFCNWFMRRIFTLSLLIGVLLSGCASSPTRWYLNGRTQQDLDSASNQCHGMAGNQINPNAYQSTGYGMGAGNPLAALGGLVQVMGQESAYNSVYEGCMSSAGFTKAK